MDTFKDGCAKELQDVRLFGQLRMHILTAGTVGI